MDYSRAFRKFISGQHLNMGIILTISVIVPAIVLYHYDIISTTTALPIGALCTGLTDSPAPPMHRRNTLAASLLINFLMVLAAGYSRVYPPLIITEIVLFGMFFSLLGVYGSRANSIGLIALLVFIFNIDAHAGSRGVLKTALLFSGGGLLYTVIALLQNTLRPYKLIQQLLGECIIETAGYLNTKAAFYKPNPDNTKLYDDLIKYQVNIQQQHQNLRELLYKTRQAVTESTRKGRILMLMFLDLLDLFERLMTSQQDYNNLHAGFDETGILTSYGNTIDALADELHEIGLAVQAGIPSKQQYDIDLLMEKLTAEFMALRAEKLSPETIESLIPLRQILYSIQDIADRIKRLHLYTTYDRKVSRQYQRSNDLDKFISHQEFEPRLLVENLSLHSSHFRHAIRITLALLLGYIISLFFPLGHGYWILLTIVTIMKPAYSITKQRNISRLLGTLTGGTIGFLAIYLSQDNTTALFAVMLFAMIIAYSFLRINYFIGVAGITVYVLLSLNFLSPKSLHTALEDRVIDTLIGSAIASIIAAFILPKWEHEQITGYIKDAIEANNAYFKVIAANFLSGTLHNTEFKLARKEAFVRLANLGDNFQRMISEPKNRQPKLELYHQFVVTSYTLTSNIAALSYYAQRTQQSYVSADFEPLIAEVNTHFDKALAIVENERPAAVDAPEAGLSINMRVQQLLDQRKKELITGRQDNMGVRNTLSDLKTITDQFYMISDITEEQSKILGKIYS
ncbi:MAG TPA: FUSC family membrane protein [Chitinophagaceae bacterium]|nr:FUSC family membrane protein [Chitinophagaceae bacterium]